MTLEEWMVRLRMMARSAVVELSPKEVADLMVAIGKNVEEERDLERMGCARIADGYIDAVFNNLSRVAQETTARAISRDIRNRR